VKIKNKVLFFIFGVFLVYLLMMGFVFNSFIKSHDQWMNSEIIYFIKRVVSLTMVFFCAGSIVGIVFLNRISRRLLEIQGGMQRVSKGELNYLTKVDSSDEIGQLADSFNQMTEELQKQAQLLRNAKEEAEIKSNELAEAAIELSEVNVALNFSKTEAEAANLAKSSFLANVSHEIRTPLNSIIGFSESVSESDNPEETRKQGQIIFREAEALLQFINDILDVAKIEANKFEIESIPFNIHETIQTIVSYADMKTQEKGINFIILEDEGIPQFLMGDPLRIRQIILNLVSNAIKFTEKGSIVLAVEMLKDKPVKIFAEDEEEVITLKFSIKDTGIGISKDRQEDIFKSFTQADGSTSRKYGGTGLGTTIVKELVEMMGGSIGLESEVNKGTMIWSAIPFVICPMSEVDKGKDKALSEILKITAQMKDQKLFKKVLVAEDYSPNQELVRLHIARLGYFMDIVDNGREAFEASQKKKYDLILMDINMPEMDGYQATQKIRESKSLNVKTPIIALTADAYESTKKICMDAGMNDVMTKPLKRNAFIQMVQKWISSSNQQEDLLDEKDNIKVEGGEDRASALIEESPPIDLEEAIYEFGGERKLLMEVLCNFLIGAKAEIKLIKEAIEIKDFERARKVSHKIRGGAANLVARPLAEMARNLESLGEDKNMGDMKLRVLQLEKEVQRLEDFISKKSYE